MNNDTPMTTTPLGLTVPVPPGAEWREHTAARFRQTDPDGYEFVVHLVREMGVTNKSKLVSLLDEHREARGLKGVSRNTIIGLMNDAQEFKPGEIDQIIQRRASLTTADALDKVEALLDQAKSAKDLGAAAMALTAVYNVKQLSTGGATRISGTSGDAQKARGFDHFKKLAEETLRAQPLSTPPAVVVEAVVVDADDAAACSHCDNDQTVPTEGGEN